MRIERTITGERRFVHHSLKGRIYSGATPEECERKTLLAALHALSRQLGRAITYDTCAKRFNGVCSFGDLTVPQMRELRNEFAESVRFGTQLEKSQRLEPMMTLAQRKRIIKLGLYSAITDRYGNQFFWKKCKEWITRLNDAKRVNLDELTNMEAHYLIQRLEKMEKKLTGTDGDE